MLESLLEPLPPNSSPHVNRLLRSNDAPLDSEALVIRSIVSDGENRMRALDAHIFHLQATLAQLSQRRDETVEHLRVHRAILSPIRRVPTELCAEQSEIWNAPMAAWFICRSWRHYALSYPLLWSSVTVSCYPSWYESETQRLLSKLQTQLFRAANASLDIHCWYGGNDPDSHLLGLVLPSSNRWRNVSFHVNSGKCRLDWLLPTSGKLDRLETLEVENFGATTFPDVFTTAPNLRRVILTLMPNTNRGAPIYLESIPIPWGPITQYRGELPGARQLEILQAAPNLLNCALEIAEGSNFIPPTDTTVTLPHLRRLCLDAAAFHLNVVAPELEELCSVLGVCMVPLITPLIQRASCTLTRLVLWQCRLHTELTDVLRALPTLSYLLLENRHHREEDGVAFFATMTISGTDSDVCPHIVSMVYGYEHWDKYASKDAFISMAKSRFRTQHALRSRLSRLRVFKSASYLEHHEPPKLDMKDQIQMLQDEGLDVAFLGEQETTEYLSRRYI
ncbi:hypothetical protein C8F04DRAFT_1241335 [Mycena alexandri]|uniref:F-box domain-containing protein n=1 Tax=Mycena alexandri TaxID=1745969 RepID=A0AAD6WS06_9AGAR|nr:hypothetical protein C8F04DRAFT_1241335 [Mycena alexandri]